MGPCMAIVGGRWRAETEAAGTVNSTPSPAAGICRPSRLGDIFCFRKASPDEHPQLQQLMTEPAPESAAAAIKGI